MKYMRRLSVLLLTSMLISPLVFAKPSHAQIRDRDWFNNRMARRFHIRGRCWISNGGGDEVIDYTSKVSEGTGGILAGIKNPKVKVVGRILQGAAEGITHLKKVIPEDGHAKCIVKKRIRPNGIRRASGTVTVNMRTFGYAGTEGDTVALTVAARTKTCDGKGRCTVIMKPKGDTVPVGASTCIEAKGKSRVVHVGLVPDDLKAELSSGGAFRDEPCNTRRDWRPKRRLRRRSGR